MIEKYLRLATIDDIPVLLKFAKNFFKASPYRVMRFNSEKGRSFLKTAIEDKRNFVVLIALEDGEPIGFLVGACQEPVFSVNKVAVELGWFIEPEHRKTRASSLIYAAYEDWAKRIGCSHVQGAYLPGVSPDLTKFYKKRGYIQTESSFVKVLKIEGDQDGCF